MSDLQIEGLYSKEADYGQECYFLIQLTGANLNRLADFIESHLQDSSWQVDIGQGHIRFETGAKDVFTAEMIESSGLLLRTDQRNLEQLAIRFREMARIETDPDYLVHAHLDQYFTSTGPGLSDVVFQRLDEFHL